MWSLLILEQALEEAEAFVDSTGHSIDTMQEQLGTFDDALGDILARLSALSSESPKNGVDDSGDSPNHSSVDHDKATAPARESEKLVQK